MIYGYVHQFSFLSSRDYVTVQHFLASSNFIRLPCIIVDSLVYVLATLSLVSHRSCGQVSFPNLKPTTRSGRNVGVRGTSAILEVAHRELGRSPQSLGSSDPPYRAAERCCMGGCSPPLQARAKVVINPNEDGSQQAC
jgi:hypothetical protein